MPTLFPLVPPEVVVSYVATNDGKVGIMTTHGFRYTITRVPDGKVGGDFNISLR